MRVVQLLPTISFGDAVSNDTLALKNVIAEMGYETDIYAENIDPRLGKHAACHVRELQNLQPEDILLYHMSTGTDLNFRMQEFGCTKVMIYHNITPPDFFRPYNLAAASLTEYGLEGVQALREQMDFCMADSAYNLSNLRDFGYQCPMFVRPILIPFTDYEQKPDEALLRDITRDGWTNLVFVGRIAPNKRQENLIRTFYHYKKRNPHSRLILVGSWTGMEKYYNRLKEYVRMLELEDVIFTGHIRFNQILSYYHAADVFLCMSEHEGFCVPLAEAMFFEVPIIALNRCAVPDTLGGSGLLLENDDPLEAALLTERLLQDAALRDAVIAGQNRRLRNFSYEKIKALFTEQLKTIIESRQL